MLYNDTVLEGMRSAYITHCIIRRALCATSRAGRETVVIMATH